MSAKNNYRSLALEISSCREVSKALKSNSHPCHRVVDWQARQWHKEELSFQGSRMHRPEAWTGDLSVAPIIFLSSNPSFDKKENFPSWEKEKWSDGKVADFGVNRFSLDRTRGFGATESRIVDDQDRTVGLDGKLSKKVSHWQWVRKVAALILEKDLNETSAITDYVMTELVHCKSPHEQGVVQALEMCRQMWLSKILALSPARILVVAGVKAGKDFAKLHESIIPADWGSWANSTQGRGRWPRNKMELNSLVKSGDWNLENQKKHSVEIEIAGLKRLVIYMARPGGGGLCSPWANPNLIHPNLLKYWREKVGVES